MTAEPTTVSKYDGELAISVPEYPQKKWHFKQKSSGGMEFFLGEESLGEVYKIEISDEKGSMSVHAINGLEYREVETKKLPNYNMVIRTLQNMGKENKKLFVQKPKKTREIRHAMALMLAAMNGRCNFDFYSPLMKRECPENCEEITREKLLKMLKRENEMRLSQEMLGKLEKDASELEERINNNNNKNTCNLNEVYIPWPIVECQEKLVKEFGYETKEQQNYALQMLRSARSLYPNDMEIKNSTFYLKYNRACLGELKVGDMLKDVPLMTCGGEEKQLSELVKEEITVIISGSVT